jgi:hypothetical protein
MSAGPGKKSSGMSLRLGQATICHMATNAMTAPTPMSKLS